MATKKYGISLEKTLVFIFMQKKSKLSLPSFLKCCEDIANLLFCIPWDAWPHPSKTIVSTYFIPHFFQEILNFPESDWLILAYNLGTRILPDKEFVVKYK